MKSPASVWLEQAKRWTQEWPVVIALPLWQSVRSLVCHTSSKPAGFKQKRESHPKARQARGAWLCEPQRHGEYLRWLGNRGLSSPFPFRWLGQALGAQGGAEIEF